MTTRGVPGKQELELGHTQQRLDLPGTPLASGVSTHPAKYDVPRVLAQCVGSRVSPYPPPVLRERSDCPPVVRKRSGPVRQSVPLGPQSQIDPSAEAGFCPGGSSQIGRRLLAQLADTGRKAAA
ncbi:hypothetical protein R1flu_016494 [Riccia fluitans]|uniref:Uncharacterized protein n=1 Tax=Riccia fluitans TaxID=41844 RepID=A0ABD1YMJ4_9MARC